MADSRGQDGEQASLGIDAAADVIVVGGGLAGLAGR
jgi:monoamine oxidase